MNENKVLLTKEGEKKLQDELSNLINIIRPEVIKELKEARSQGDLSENADYDAARNRQAEVEGRIREIEDYLSHVKIIKHSNTNKNIKERIKLGSVIHYQKMNKKHELLSKHTIKIVGAVEANPFKNTISNESPFAMAIMNHINLDIVEIKTDKSNYKIKILSVK